MAKKFMYVCFGIMALAVAMHFGVQPVRSQVDERPVFFEVDGMAFFVMTDEGNIYECYRDGASLWQLVENWPGDLPTGAMQSSWGSIKAKWHEEE